MKQFQTGLFFFMILFARPLFAVTDSSSSSGEEGHPRQLLRSPQVIEDEAAEQKIPYLDPAPYYQLDQEKFAAKKKKNKKKRKKTKKAPEESSGELTYWHFMPLGAGQFYNGSPILGSVFALTQVGSFGLFIMNYLGADAKFADTNSYIDQRNTEYGTLTTSSEQQAHLEETNRRVADMDAERATMEQQANLGLIIAAIAFAGGVAEAVINRGDDDMNKETKKKTKKKQRKKKKSALNDSDVSDVLLVDTEIDWPHHYRERLDWGLAPVYNSLHVGKVGLGLSMKYQF
ncbi:MAG: hypothetical protein H6618_01780 [Deltaproteobacteria bacterium]|nr:hypothetical protein [Deltaproteobacteria bacterium]